MAVAVDASQILAKAKFLPHTVDKDDDLQYDLANLLAVDVHPIDPTAYGEDAEEHIKAVARENAQLLFNRIFSLPTEKAEVGILAVLPPATTKIPREKPVPKPKAPTRWELFRQVKGIQKRKKERLVWDENSQEWKPRYGSHRANNEEDDWVIEAKDGDDPDVDPFEKRAEEKKEKIAKQKKNELRNRARGEKGELKSLPPVMAVNNAVPKTDKADIKSAIDIARTSTASMGVFTPALPGEKVKQKPSKKADHKADIGKEKQTSLSVLDKVLGRNDKKSPLNINKAINKFTTQEREKRAEAKRSGPSGGGAGGRKGGFKGGAGGRGGKGGKSGGGRKSGGGGKGKDRKSVV